MDKIIQEATQELIDKIRKSDVYLEYLKQRDSLLSNPELFQRVNDFREKNFKLQNDNHENIFERSESLTQEYSDIWDVPVVNDFLVAELDFCRMIQGINMMIAAEVDFD